MNSPTRSPLSFIIPVLNGEQFIGRCLEHIRRESATGDQIMVVDNGSVDRTLPIVQATPGVTLIEAPGVTSATLRNRGARVAKHDVLAFVDADCLLCPGWRAALERVLADPTVSATGAYYDVPDDATWVERAWWSFRPRHEHRTSFLISGNLIVRRAAFESVGGFDERLTTDEDTDLSRRLVSTGAVLIEAPSLKVVHLGNARTLAQFLRKERWHATGVLAAVRTHRFDRRLLLTFVFMAACMVAAALPLGVTGFAAAAGIAALIMMVPIANAAYQLIKYGNYRYFFHLLALFLIVYCMRSAVVAGALVPRGRAV